MSFVRGSKESKSHSNLQSQLWLAVELSLIHLVFPVRAGAESPGFYLHSGKQVEGRGEAHHGSGEVLKVDTWALD